MQATDDIFSLPVANRLLGFNISSCFWAGHLALIKLILFFC